MGCKSVDNSPIPNHCNNTIVYRFLYQNNYGIEINEKSFWSTGKYEGQEMAVRLTKLPFKSFIEAIQTFEISDQRTGAYYFAIVDRCKDTIYSSEDLKSWIIKKNGKSYFYKYPDKAQVTTDTTFIKDILIAEPFLRNWNCDNRFKHN